MFFGVRDACKNVIIELKPSEYETAPEIAF